MNLSILTEPGSPRNRTITTIKRASDRYEFLISGRVTAKPWIDTKKRDTVFVPCLNGITVNTGIRLKYFATRQEAIAEGYRIRLMIQKHLGIRMSGE